MSAGALDAQTASMCCRRPLPTLPGDGALPQSGETVVNTRVALATMCNSDERKDCRDASSSCSLKVCNQLEILEPLL